MRLIFIILGGLLLSIGLFLILIYLNLFVIGYTFWNFVYFIIRSGIILFVLGGIILIYLGMER